MTDTTFPQIPISTGARLRRRMTPKDARLRTLRVKTVRILFLAGAMLAILALVGSVIIQVMQGKARVSDAVVQGENLVIESPRFVGRTKDGGKVIVTAKTATRPLTGQEGKVTLELPVMETSDGSRATAKTGVWSQSEETLSLDGDVVLAHQSGDRATSSRAFWNSVSSRLELMENVVLARQNGDQAASNLAVWTSDPSVLTVTGNVNVKRQSGASMSSGTAAWRSDLGSLDIGGGVRISLPTGESATSQTASFKDRSGDLSLLGQVLVTFPAGQARSARADYSGLTGRLSGEGGIQVRSSLGIGSASRYVYETRSKRLSLSGDVRAQLQ
jgi:hypothetical protein